MRNYLKAFLFFLFSFSFYTYSEDGWKGDGSGYITAIQIEIFRNGGEGSKVIFLETSNITSADCGGSTWVIRTDLDEDNRIYSSALAAFSAGYKVQIYQWSCISVGGSNYPRIGGIKVINL